jgi:cobalt-zinc-cadmium efflux system outer membrane protein
MTRRFGMLMTTIACSILGCSGPLRLPEQAKFAPAALIEPTVPRATPPDRSAPWTLPALLAYADAHAPAVRVARARTAVVGTQRIDAAINLPANPQVGIAAGVRRAGERSGFDYELSIAQQLEVAGEPGLRRTAAAARHETAKARTDAVRWTTHVEVHRLFVALLLVAEQRVQAERFIALSKALRHIAARTLAAGETEPLVLLIADADLARTEALRIEVERQERSLRARLAAVIGWSGNPLSVTGKLPPVQPAPALDHLLSKMSEAHPSMRIQELAVVARNADARLAERDAWPEPTVGVSVARESAPGGGEAPADIFMLTVGVPLPLWRRNQGERARAVARARLADDQRAANAIRLRSELTAAVAELDAAAARVAVFDRDVMPNLETNLRLLERAYTLGEVDAHQVSQTRERLLNAARQALAARIAFYDAAATLEGLAGVEIWTTQEAP